ncbi:MAG: hypothetical protein GX240_02955 [Candidatus Atribacteria bacterium]|nr:hypothetical protein [Candidatus Atribacteria bacterium]
MIRESGDLLKRVCCLFVLDLWRNKHLTLQEIGCGSFATAAVFCFIEQNFLHCSL